jgi:hypothetical protein
MASTSDYCEHCDLPLSQCVHGQPPPPPPEKKAAPAPRARRTSASTSTTRTSSTPAVSVSSKPPRRTPQRDFRRYILAALQERDGRADIEDLMADLVERMEPVLRDADHETVNQGEVRWRYAARLERKAMLDDGLIMAPREPGVWELTDLGRATTE